MKGARAVTRDVIRAMLSKTKSTRDILLITLGFSTGYRISELLSICIKDVMSKDFVVSSHITVKGLNTKTGVGRSVFLNTDSREAIVAHVNSRIAERVVKISNRKGADRVVGKSIQELRRMAMDEIINEPLFDSRKLNKDGSKRLGREQAYKILKDLFAQVGETGNVSTHTLRKTFAAYIYESCGKKIEVVQAALGHASISSTIAYLAIHSGTIETALHNFRF